MLSYNKRMRISTLVMMMKVKESSSRDKKEAES